MDVVSWYVRARGRQAARTERGKGLEAEKSGRESFVVAGGLPGFSAPVPMVLAASGKVGIRAD